ncbi:Jerky protein-like-like [Holothuria leucospilota]|uniref:Jerky protein-like-like n=1 Tax=Holothuria leucospilota TaxID=206669 RepID=A0A9Q0YRD8_HOLLE|nr:Jerky protein-like-like [Holothuria leucospilota]
MLRQCLYQLPFPPDAITEDVVQRMAMAVEKVEVIESQFVLLKGNRAKGIYIVTNGEAQVLSSQGDTIANLLPGDFFGELSTLFYIPCTATVQALEGTSLLLIKMEKLRKALGEEKVVSVGLEEYFVRRKYFDTSGAVPQAENLLKIAKLDMKKWGESAVKYILELVSPNSEVGPVTLIPPNTFICHEGEKVDEITIITKGLVASMQEKKMVSELDANYWPLWFGEREHFTDRRPTITVRTITACQAVVIKFSEIAMAKNQYKDDVSTSLRYWNDKWRKKTSQLEKVGLSARNSAKVEIQVLIRRLHESGIVSNAPVALYHQLAMASLPKHCQDGAIIYDPKPIGGTTGRPKGRKKKSRINDSVWSMTLEDAEQLIEDDDKLFLVLQGSIGVVGVNTTSFRSGLPVSRNSLSFRYAGNIKRARARVSVEDIEAYFKQLEPVLTDIELSHVYNYDETNVTDEPGAKKVVVPRGMKRVERVQEHSKMTVSLMVCGSAAGEMLLPFIVYKAQNLYENWTTYGPPGAKYDATPGGWFDTRTFTHWFLELFLPHVSDQEGVKVLVGDNLGSHFSPDVVSAAISNNIYFTALPPNSTHLTQPLDVVFFRPMKVMWRSVLNTWRIKTRRQGSIPKEVFPSLLRDLWQQMEINSPSNFCSGFRETGLCPLDPQQVLKNLPGSTTKLQEGTKERDADVIGRDFDDSLIQLLKENHGQKDQPKQKCGRKLSLVPRSRWSPSLPRTNVQLLLWEQELRTTMF